MMLTSLWDQTSTEGDNNSVAYAPLHLMRISRWEWMRPRYSLQCEQKGLWWRQVAGHLHVKKPGDTKNNRGLPGTHIETQMSTYWVWHPRSFIAQFFITGWCRGACKEWSFRLIKRAVFSYSIPPFPRWELRDPGSSFMYRFPTLQE